MLLYDSPVSGNCYKVRLLFAHLGIAYERRWMDVADRSDRPELLGGLNPALRVPTLVLDDGRSLGESGAILWYFGEGTAFVPEDRFERALRTYLLRDADAGVADEHAEKQRVLWLAERERHPTGDGEDQVEEREDVGPDDARVGTACRRGRRRAALGEPPRSLHLCEPRHADIVAQTRVSDCGLFRIPPRMVSPPSSQALGETRRLEGGPERTSAVHDLCRRDG